MKKETEHIEMDFTPEETREIMGAIDKLLAGFTAPCRQPDPVVEESTPPPVIVRGKAADYHFRNVHKDSLLTGCFDAWIKKSGGVVPLLFEHKPHLKAGEATLFTREDGLHHISRLEDTPTGRDMQRLIKCGALDSFSIKYLYDTKLNPKDEFGDSDINAVEEIEELSIVMYPGAWGAVIEGKRCRECSGLDYFNRLGKFWTVKRDLEVEEIRETLLAEWKKVYLNF